MKAFAEMYQRAWAAKLALSGPGAWEHTFKILNDVDVCAYIDPEHIQSGPERLGTIEMEVGERPQPGPERPSMNSNGIDLVPQDIFDLEHCHKRGTRLLRMQLSWIWTTTHVNNNDGVDLGDEIMQEVWVKSHAHVERAKEEVLRLREEIQRTLMFLIEKAQWWKDRAEVNLTDDPVLSEGIRAYMLKQENIQTNLAFHLRVCGRFCLPMLQMQFSETMIQRRGSWMRSWMMMRERRGRIRMERIRTER